MTAEGAGAPAGAIDVRAVRRHFARAVATYDGAAVLQREVGSRLAARLEVVRLAPRRILDAGCGTGHALLDLEPRFPAAVRVGLDLALPMLACARARTAGRATLGARLLARLASRSSTPAPAFACGDIAALPFAAGAFDLVWSNLALQWVGEPQRAFAGLRRVISDGGLLAFTTFGPDTLRELRGVFAAVDGEPHVSRFVDLHDLGDMLVAAGFSDPVMEMECFTLTYPDAPAFLRDLKAIGATNAAAGRARGLMGRRRWAQLLEGLDAVRRGTPDARLPATYEVIYGHAWKAPATTTADGRAIVNLVRPAAGGRAR
jgi:malonyl-CoA O-methyltransferase